MKIRSERTAFTLIELLVVIGIIGILMGLLSAAVMKAFDAANRANTRSEIAMLDSALREKVKFKAGIFPPSQLSLHSSIGSYGATQVEQDSLFFLKAMFGANLGANGTPITWNLNSGGDTVLTGDEVLVFVLGGIQNSPGGAPNCLGFSTDPTNPGNTGVQMNPPMFQFQSNRLVSVNGNGYYSYLDYYKKIPYAFYSAANRMNGYSGYSASCPALSPSGPYLVSAGTYFNPDSFQIFSAGTDYTFGPGNVIWTSGAGGSGMAGRDDLCNFTSSVLGGNQ